MSWKATTCNKWLTAKVLLRESVPEIMLIKLQGINIYLLPGFRQSIGDYSPPPCSTFCTPHFTSIFTNASLICVKVRLLHYAFIFGKLQQKWFKIIHFSLDGLGPKSSRQLFLICLLLHWQHFVWYLIWSTLSFSVTSLHIHDIYLSICIYIWKDKATKVLQS